MLIVLAVLALAGCAAPPMIHCTNRAGEVTYVGPFDEKLSTIYVHQIDPYSRDIYSKQWCHKQFS